jgi:hypothetical protein
VPDDVPFTVNVPVVVLVPPGANCTPIVHVPPFAETALPATQVPPVTV